MVRVGGEAASFGIVGQAGSTAEERPDDWRYSAVAAHHAFAIACGQSYDFVEADLFGCRFGLDCCDVVFHGFGFLLFGLKLIGAQISSAVALETAGLDFPPTDEVDV